MSRIVIAAETVHGLSSNVIEYCGEISKLEKCLQSDAQDVLEKVFHQNKNLTTLNDEFQCFLKSGKSDCFRWMYCLTDTLGLAIDEHIYLYGIHEKKLLDVQLKRFGWAYMSGKYYLGDSWWFSDEEILSDIHQMTTYEFLEKYKGLAK